MAFSLPCKHWSWEVRGAGVVQRRLSNGIRINYWRTDNEPRAALVRMVFPGGRAMESWDAGPSGVGAVSIGARTLSESGTVGQWRREQVRIPSVLRLLLQPGILSKHHKTLGHLAS